MLKKISIPRRKIRRFVPEDLVIESWETIKSLFENLIQRKIKSISDLERWMLDRSELEAVLEEDIPVAMASFSFIGIFALIAHFIADISYAYLDPRIRIQSQG